MSGGGPLSPLVLLAVLAQVAARPSHPIQHTGVDGAEGESAPWYGVTLLGVCFAVTCLLVVLSCACCRQRRDGFKPNEETVGEKEFTNSTGSLTNIGFTNNLASELSIFPPAGVATGSRDDGRGSPPRASPPPQFTKPANFKSAIPDVSDWFVNPNANYPRQQLFYQREIGKGWFGKVVEGEARGNKVVVKILKEDATPEEKAYFLNEVKPFRDLRHRNVMTLFGRCLDHEPYLILFEMQSNGDLKSFLVTNRGSRSAINEQGIGLRMMTDIAEGLNYMIDNGFIHTDLAARNCLIGADLTVKIGDYGTGIELYKDEYYIVENVAIPIRWCAPETVHCTPTTIETKQVGISANIWSLGVVLWEIATFGGLPYEELTDDQVIIRVFGGEKLRLPQPDCPYGNYLHSIMQLCWRVTDRVSLSEVLSMLHYLRSYPTLEQSDFDTKWNRTKPNTIPVIDNHTPVHSPRHTALAQRPALLQAKSDFDSGVDLEIRTTTDETPDSCRTGTPMTISPQLSVTSEEFFHTAGHKKSPSLTNLQGSLDDVSWLQKAEDDGKFVQNISQDLALGKTSSGESSIELNKPSSTTVDFRLGRTDDAGSSDTEDENWRRRVERGEFTEKVREKSKSVTDLMVLTHIDSEGSETDSLPSLTRQYSIKKNGAMYTSIGFGSEGNIRNAVLGEELQEKLRGLSLWKADDFGEDSEQRTFLGKAASEITNNSKSKRPFAGKIVNSVNNCKNVINRTETVSSHRNSVPDIVVTEPCIADQYVEPVSDVNTEILLETKPRNFVFVCHADTDDSSPNDSIHSNSDTTEVSFPDKCAKPEDMSSAILWGSCEEYTLDYFRGLKTTFVPPESCSDDEADNLKREEFSDLESPSSTNGLTMFDDIEEVLATDVSPTSDGGTLKIDLGDSPPSADNAESPSIEFTESSASTEVFLSEVRNQQVTAKRSEEPRVRVSSTDTQKSVENGSPLSDVSPTVLFSEARRSVSEPNELLEVSDMSFESEAFRITLPESLRQLECDLPRSELNKDIRNHIDHPDELFVLTPKAENFTALIDDFGAVQVRDMSLQNGLSEDIRNSEDPEVEFLESICSAKAVPTRILKLEERSKSFPEHHVDAEKELTVAEEGSKPKFMEHECSIDSAVSLSENDLRREKNTGDGVLKPVESSDYFSSESHSNLNPCESLEYFKCINHLNDRSLLEGKPSEKCPSFSSDFKTNEMLSDVYGVPKQSNHYQAYFSIDTSHSCDQDHRMNDLKNRLEDVANSSDDFQLKRSEEEYGGKLHTPDDERSSDSGFRDKGSLSESVEDTCDDKYNLEDIDAELDDFPPKSLAEKDYYEHPADDTEKNHPRLEGWFLHPPQENGWVSESTEGDVKRRPSIDDEYVLAIRNELKEKLACAQQSQKLDDESSPEQEKVEVQFTYPAQLSPILEEQESNQSSLILDDSPVFRLREPSPPHDTFEQDILRALDDLKEDTPDKESVVVEDLEGGSETVYVAENCAEEEDMIIVDTETNKVTLVESPKPQSHLAFVSHSRKLNENFKSDSDEDSIGVNSETYNLSSDNIPLTPDISLGSNTISSPDNGILSGFYLSPCSIRSDLFDSGPPSLPFDLGQSIEEVEEIEGGKSVDNEAAEIERRLVNIGVLKKSGDGSSEGTSPSDNQLSPEETSDEAKSKTVVGGKVTSAAQNEFIFEAPQCPRVEVELVEESEAAGLKNLNGEEFLKTSLVIDSLYTSKAAENEDTVAVTGGNNDSTSVDLITFENSCGRDGKVGEDEELLSVDGISQSIIGVKHDHRTPDSHEGRNGVEVAPGECYRVDVLTPSCTGGTEFILDSEAEEHRKSDDVLTYVNGLGVTTSGKDVPDSIPSPSVVETSPLTPGYGVVKTKPENDRPSMSLEEMTNISRIDSAKFVQPDFQFEPFPFDSETANGEVLKHPFESTPKSEDLNVEPFSFFSTTLKDSPPDEDASANLYQDINGVQENCLNSCPDTLIPEDIPCIVLENGSPEKSSDATFEALFTDSPLASRQNIVSESGSIVDSFLAKVGGKAGENSRPPLPPDASANSRRTVKEIRDIFESNCPKTSRLEPLSKMTDNGGKSSEVFEGGHSPGGGETITVIVGEHDCPDEGVASQVEDIFEITSSKNTEVSDRFEPFYLKSNRDESIDDFWSGVESKHPDRDSTPLIIIEETPSDESCFFATPEEGSAQEVCASSADDFGYFAAQKGGIFHRLQKEDNVEGVAGCRDSGYLSNGNPEECMTAFNAVVEEADNREDGSSQFCLDRRKVEVSTPDRGDPSSEKPPVTKCGHGETTEECGDNGYSVLDGPLVRERVQITDASGKKESEEHNDGAGVDHSCSTQCCQPQQEGAAGTSRGGANSSTLALVSPPDISQSTDSSKSHSLLSSFSSTPTGDEKKFPAQQPQQACWSADDPPSTSSGDRTTAPLPSPEDADKGWHPTMGQLLELTDQLDGEEMTTSFIEPDENGLYTPDWESDTSDEHSSSSGEFIWKPQESVAMERIDEEEEHGSDNSGEDEDDLSEGSAMEFVPSTWDSTATPTKSALKSLPASASSEKKKVMFKREKYQCVYEYPREPSEDEQEDDETETWQTPNSYNYSVLTDWEFGESEFPCAAAEGDSDSEEKNPKKAKDYDFYRINYNIGSHFMLDEGEFYLGGSSGEGSEFFPGGSCDDSSLEFTPLASSDTWQPGHVQPACGAAAPAPLPGLGELRHTKDQLRLELPSIRPDKEHRSRGGGGGGDDWSMWSSIMEPWE